MHAQTFRAKNTRQNNGTHRFRNSRSQKVESIRFSDQFRKQTLAHSSPLRSSHSPYPHRSTQPFHHCSRSPRRHHSSSSPHSSPDRRARDSSNPQASPSSHEPSPMTIVISAAFRRWLREKGFEGCIRVTEAPPHPEAFNIAKKLNVDTITNATIR